MLVVDDSVQIAEHAASLGLLDPAQVDDVRRETHSNGPPRVPWAVDVARSGSRIAHRLGRPDDDTSDHRSPL